LENKKKSIENRKIIYILLIHFLLLIIIGGVFAMNLIFLWMGIAELVVAGMIYAISSITTSQKIKAFCYMGIAILLVLAGYQFVNAFA